MSRLMAVFLVVALLSTAHGEDDNSAAVHRKKRNMPPQPPSYGQPYSPQPMPPQYNAGYKPQYQQQQQQQQQPEAYEEAPPYSSPNYVPPGGYGQGGYQPPAPPPMPYQQPSYPPPPPIYPQMPPMMYAPAPPAYYAPPPATYPPAPVYNQPYQAPTPYQPPQPYTGGSSSNQYIQTPPQQSYTAPTSYVPQSPYPAPPPGYGRQPPSYPAPPPTAMNYPPPPPPQRGAPYGPTPPAYPMPPPPYPGGMPPPNYRRVGYPEPASAAPLPRPFGSCAKHFINCIVDTRIQCLPNKEILVEIEFESPFRGRVFIWNKFEECVLHSGPRDGPGQRAIVFRLTENTCPNYPGFVSSIASNDFEDPGAFRGRQFRVVVAFDQDYLSVEDVNFVVRCENENATRRNTLFEYQTADRQPVIITKSERNSRVRGVLRLGNTLRSPIVDGPVLLGSPLIIHISLLKRATHRTQVLATNCIAVEGTPMDEMSGVIDERPRTMQLISNGCSLRPKIIDNFAQTLEKVGSKTFASTVAQIQAFRFPRSDIVAIRCRVNICLDRCPPPPSCPPTFLGKRVGQMVFRQVAHLRRQVDDREIARTPLNVLLAQQKKADEEEELARVAVDTYASSIESEEDEEDVVLLDPARVILSADEDMLMKRKRRHAEDLRAGGWTETHIVEFKLPIKRAQHGDEMSPSHIQEVRTRRSSAPPPLTIGNAIAWPECDGESAKLSLKQDEEATFNGTISISPWLMADESHVDNKTCFVKADVSLLGTTTVRLPIADDDACDVKKKRLYVAQATNGQETKETILDCQEDVVLSVDS